MSEDGAPRPVVSWVDPDYIERLKQQIQADGELRLIMDIAHRVGLPASEVQARWSGWDLALEVAYSALKLEAEIRTCPGCGIDPATMLDRHGRNLGKDPAWRLQVQHCDFCAERDELAARVGGRSSDYEPAPPRVRYVPRLGDEPFAPESAEWGLGGAPPTGE